MLVHQSCSTLCAGILALTSLIAAAPTSLGHGGFSGPAPLVRVKNGTYRGVYNANYNQDNFLGIPFAQPPVGPGRLNVPMPLNSSFTEVRSAEQFGPACIGYGVSAIGV